MPEGPETHRAARLLASVLAGHEVLEVTLALPALARFETILRGRVIERVTARGKAMLVCFAGDWVLYSHNQLYGRWVVTRGGARPRTSRSLRVALRTPVGEALLYSASDIAVLRGPELESHPYLARLGPDALDPATTAESIEERLGSPRFSRRSLGALLLDQSFVAGLGNYLRSEILHVARLHHDQTPREFAPEDRRRLADATLLLARRSLAQAGVTVPRGLASSRRAAGATRQQSRFFVFDREGQPCDGCGTAIIREETGGRRIYFCPRCQPGDSRKLRAARPTTRRKG